MKLTLLRAVQNETFYYPHSLDFRGRVYPIHVHFQPQGPDVCRGLLLYAQPKRLGARGLDWLLIQVCWDQLPSLSMHSELILLPV